MMKKLKELEIALILQYILESEILVDHAEAARIPIVELGCKCSFDPGLIVRKVESLVNIITGSGPHREEMLINNVIPAARGRTILLKAVGEERSMEWTVVINHMVPKGDNL